MDVRRLELAEGDGVGEERECDLGADGGDLHFGADKSQVLDRSGSAESPVTHEPGRLVVLFGIEIVDRVLQRG